ncbi:hypothetical protein RvY_07997 [Ramazzottius varieornatus]|uniref:Major facilitator superfamily (MFS) profile domain-containing protein n=1 Tax=Ramazzottius varieornatus TaxID=947166 RepID=A0A1D1VDI7_RAMVA|nr:hypothetical protein RvY_07997 [Ramazzottius varieornatus]
MPTEVYRSTKVTKTRSPYTSSDENSPLVRSLSGVSEKTSPYYGAIRAAPVVLMFGLAFGIYGPSYVELLKYKVCELHHNFSSEVCAHLVNKYNHNEMDAVRKTTSAYQLYSVLLESIPAIILSLFLGSWSDHFGRKRLLLVPFFGLAAAAAWAAFCVIRPVPPSYLLVSPVLSSLLGGRFIIMMAVFSYIGDFTDSSNRAINNAIIEGLLVIAMNGGSFLGGYLFEKAILYPFMVAGGLYLACFLYGIVAIHDLRPPPKYGSDGCSDLFSLRHLRESFDLLNKERTGETRLHVCLILLASFISNIAYSGKSAVTQLFLEFEPFRWTLQQYSFFQGLLGLVGSVSVVFTVAFLRRCFRMTETSIAMVAYTSAIIGYIGYSVATEGWHIYASAGFGHMRLLCMVCVRSVLGELVGKNELGRAMALISVIQSIAPLLGSIIFVGLFHYTATWWSGLAFAVGSFALIVVLAIFAYVDIERRDWIYAKRRSASGDDWSNSS